jgi:hypothetical protein
MPAFVSSPLLGSLLLASDPSFYEILFLTSTVNRDLRESQTKEWLTRISQRRMMHRLARQLREFSISTKKLDFELPAEREQLEGCLALLTRVHAECAHLIEENTRKGSLQHPAISDRIRNRGAGAGRTG